MTRAEQPCLTFPQNRCENICFFVVLFVLYSIPLFFPCFVKYLTFLLCDMFV